MPNHVRIRLATLDDAAAIWTLQQLAYQQEARLYNDFSIAPLRESPEELRGLFAQMTFMKAVRGEEIVGAVRAELRDDTCYIGRLIVHPAYQRQGIGFSLMQAIETHFACAERFELFTGHLSEGNLRLYQRLGYTIYSTETVTPTLSFLYFEKIRQ